MNAGFAGFFACAALHHGLHWWRSREERVLLIFTIQCAGYAIFCLAMASYYRATTIPDIQSALDRFVTIALLVHAVAIQLYAELGARRDRTFRLLVTGALVFFAVRNQWAPLRGTVIALQTVQLPEGTTRLLPLRSAPNAWLAIGYLVLLLVYGYGFFVARVIARRDRAGALLIAFATSAMVLGLAIGIWVDFARLPAPYAGAGPHASPMITGAPFNSSHRCRT